MEKQNDMLEKLSRLSYLYKNIQCDKQRLLELRGMAESCTSFLSGMPNSRGKQDRLARIVEKITDLEQQMQQEIEDSMAEYQWLNEFIMAIEDPLIKMIFKCRYIRQMNWVRIAMEVGGCNTKDSVRMLHNRFLQKNELVCPKQG